MLTCLWFSSYQNVSVWKSSELSVSSSAASVQRTFFPKPSTKGQCPGVFLEAQILLLRTSTLLCLCALKRVKPLRKATCL